MIPPAETGRFFSDTYAFLPSAIAGAAGPGCRGRHRLWTRCGPRHGPRPSRAPSPRDLRSCPDCGSRGSPSARRHRRPAPQRRVLSPRRRCSAGLVNPEGDVAFCRNPPSVFDGSSGWGGHGRVLFAAHLSRPTLFVHAVTHPPAARGSPRRAGPGGGRWVPLPGNALPPTVEGAPAGDGGGVPGGQAFSSPACRGRSRGVGLPLPPSRRAISTLPDPRSLMILSVISNLLIKPIWQILKFMMFHFFSVLAFPLGYFVHFLCLRLIICVFSSVRGNFPFLRERRWKRPTSPGGPTVRSIPGSSSW